MPRDIELEELRTILHRGALYQFNSETEKFILGSSKVNFKTLKNRQFFIYLKLERAKTRQNSFRLHIVRGEDLGYILVDRADIVSCIKHLDPSEFLG